MSSYLINIVSVLQIIFVVVFCSGLQVQSQDIRFKKLIVNETPFMANVLNIYQDRKGYIWVCTEDGLHKYDGSKITSYRHSISDSTSISDNYITSIAEDSKGFLWVGTTRGLNQYQEVTESFKRYYLNPVDSNHLLYDNITALLSDSKGMLWILSHMGVVIYNPADKSFANKILPSKGLKLPILDIRCILEDYEGLFWIGTMHGVYVYDPKSQEVKHYYFGVLGPNSLTDDFISNLAEDKEHNIWMGSFNGLLQYNRKNRDFTFYKYNSHEPYSISDNQIRDILITETNNLWIATNNGLNLGVWNRVKNTMEFKKYFNRAGNEYSISSNSITSVTMDNEGRLWIGSRFGGVDIYDNKSKNFEHYHNILGDKSSLSNNNVTCFTEDMKGDIWVSTDEGGLNKFDKTNNTFKHFTHDIKNSNSISNNKVLAVLADSRNILWLGYWGEGIDWYDIENNSFRHFSSDLNNPNSISSNFIFYIYEDSRKNVWICCWGGGVTLYDRASDKFIKLPDNSNNIKGLRTTNVNVAYEDKEGTIWFGSENYGLYSYRYDKNVFCRYVQDDHDPRSISHNNIAAICEDSKGRLWIGTLGGGLNLMNRHDGTFKAYATIDGLADNFVCGILEDENGFLWVSTHKGISRILFNEKNRKTPFICKNYNKYDGLQGDKFNIWAFFKSRNGEMYFGGVNGFTKFFPGNIFDNEMIPKVKITALYVYNDNIGTKNSKIPLKVPVDELKKIVFSYKDNMITIEFSALNYTDPLKNQYAYRLQGLEKHWHNSGHYNKAVYTNLDPGQYIFQVRASNNDGVWNNAGASLTIIITPPFWQKIWFRVMAVSLMIGLFYYIFKLRIRALKRELERQREYEKVLKVAKVKAEESDMLKSSILANISHEIRTPMNGIIGFSELMSRPKLKEERRKKYVKIIKNSCDDLAHTLDSILDLSTIVAGTMQISENVSTINIILDSLVKTEISKIKEIQKDLTIEVRDISGKADQSIKTDFIKLKTILWQLLNNAVKFSEKGLIILGYEFVNEHIQFYISDPGIGIPEKNREIIFEQFRQSELGMKRRYGGTGLGLSLCKGFLDLVGGKIWFESEVGKGSTFYFTFPYKNA